MHTKKELQRSTFGPKPGQRAHVPQVDPKSGEPRGFDAASGVHHISHGIQGDHGANTKHFLGKAPKEKAARAVPVSHGMHHQVRGGAYVADVSPTEALAMAGTTEANPLAPVPSSGKRLSAPAPAHGMKHNSISARSFEGLQKLGAAILSEAVKSGGHIPIKPTENT